MGARLNKLNQAKAEYLARNPGMESDWNRANLEELVIAKAMEEGDTEFLRALEVAEDLKLVSEAARSHYDVGLTSATRGAKADRGKITLKARPMHGGSNDLNALNARAMALDSAMYGPVVQRGDRPESAYDQRLRLAAQRVLAPVGASALAGVGLRGGALPTISAPDRMLRAEDRLLELSHGYNPVTGAPYAGQGLDGGHKVAHNANEALSALRENMMFENKYENRAKGDRSGQAEIDAFVNSLKNKVSMSAKRDPEVSPARFAGVWPVGTGY